MENIRVKVKDEGTKGISISFLCDSGNVFKGLKENEISYKKVELESLYSNFKKDLQKLFEIRVVASGLRANELLEKYNIETLEGHKASLSDVNEKVEELCQKYHLIFE